MEDKERHVDETNCGRALKQPEVYANDLQRQEAALAAVRSLSRLQHASLQNNQQGLYGRPQQQPQCRLSTASQQPHAIHGLKELSMWMQQYLMKVPTKLGCLMLLLWRACCPCW